MERRSGVYSQTQLFGYSRAIWMRVSSRWSRKLMILPDRSQDRLKVGLVPLQGKRFRHEAVLSFPYPRGSGRRARFHKHNSIPHRGGHWHLSLA